MTLGKFFDLTSLCLSFLIHQKRLLLSTLDSSWKIHWDMHAKSLAECLMHSMHKLVLSLSESFKIQGTTAWVLANSILTLSRSSQQNFPAWWIQPLHNTYSSFWSTDSSWASSLLYPHGFNYHIYVGDSQIFIFSPDLSHKNLDPYIQLSSGHLNLYVPQVPQVRMFKTKPYSTRFLSLGETSLFTETTKGDFKEEVTYKLRFQIRVWFNLGSVKGKGIHSSEIQVHRSRKFHCVQWRARFGYISPILPC